VKPLDESSPLWRRNIRDVVLANVGVGDTIVVRSEGTWALVLAIRRRRTTIGVEVRVVARDEGG
jgi:hypothetical protein